MALYSYVLKTSMDKKVHCITSLGTIFLFFSPCPGSEISSSGGHQRCSSALPKSLCRGMKIVLTCNLKGDEHVVETVALSLIVKSKKEKKKDKLKNISSVSCFSGGVSLKQRNNRMTD